MQPPNSPNKQLRSKKQYTRERPIRLTDADFEKIVASINKFDHRRGRHKARISICLLCILIVLGLALAAGTKWYGFDLPSASLAGIAVALIAPVVAYVSQH